MGKTQWLALGAFLAGMATGDSAAIAEDTTIVLGTVIPLSGQHMNSGLESKRGYELAIRKINQAAAIQIGGKRVQLKLKFYDDGSDSVRVQELVDRLIRKDRVSFLLGPYHGGKTNSTIAVAERRRIPMISPHSVALGSDADEKRYAFAVPSEPRGYFSPLLEFAATVSSQLGKASNEMRIAMATEDDAFSREVRAGVLQDAKRLGMACVIDDRLPAGFADMSGTLNTVQQVKPDLFLISGHEEAASSAVRQIEQSGTEIPIVAVTHCRAAHLASDTSGASDFVFCPVQWDRDAPHKGELFGTAEDFARAFEKAYGHEPTPVAAQTAVSVYVFADAFNRAQSIDPEKVRNAISRTDLETFFGRIKFNGQGSNENKSTILMQIVDGDYVVVAPEAWAKRKAVLKKPQQ